MNTRGTVAFLWTKRRKCLREPRRRCGTVGSGKEAQKKSIKLRVTSSERSLLLNQFQLMIYGSMQLHKIDVFLTKPET